MRKKSEAQVFLEQVEKLDTMIECKLAEKRQWRDQALSITASATGERVSASGSQSRMADAVARCYDIEGEISDTVDALVARKKEVTRIIEQVGNPTEYKLLHMRYVQHLDLKAIAEHFGSDYTWATTCHGRALKSVEKILAERFVTSCD